MMIQEPYQDHYFRISTQKLQSQFQCTICTNPINDCYITRCGHVFCKACIEEAVGRHHRCPFCNQALNDFKADVFKNYHFNTLKKIIDDQRKFQNQKYLNKVFKGFKQDKEGQDRLMKPVQQIIISRCEQALLRYRSALLQLYNGLKQTQEKKLIMGLQNVKNNQIIIKELQNTIIAGLPNPVIAPDIIGLVTSIEVILPNKKTFKSTIKLAPLAPLSSILPFLQNVCSQMNVRVQGKIPNILIINGEQKNLDDKIGILSGQKIKVQGIPFAINTYCFTYNWQKTKMTNFYNCKTCNMKWICQSCTNLCHKDHTSILQIKDHKPDWACCYCVTKCQCKAINKNSQK